MITEKNSIPRKSDAFLKGIDIFYSQFNDVSFYIEDQDQENLYFEILKKLFPQIKLTKIFPLNGKTNVITKSKRCLNNKKKVFIVDKDFDDLLGKKINQANLFYLERYSIENYLLEQQSLKQYIIEEKPKAKLKDINSVLQHSECSKIACKLYHDITLLHLLTQYKGLPLKNTSLPPERFINFSAHITIKNAEVTKYKNAIQQELTKIDGRFKLSSQLKKLKTSLNIKKRSDLLNEIPGKYLVRYFKSKIEHLFGLVSRNVDSFVYKLAKNCDLISLSFLKVAINSYVTG